MQGKGASLTISLGDNLHTSVYINKELGAPDAWTEMDTPAGLAYSRSFLVLLNDPSRIMIIAPGPNPGVGDNEVLVTTIDLDNSTAPYPERYTGHQASGQCGGRHSNGTAGNGTMPGAPQYSGPVQVSGAGVLSVGGLAVAAAVAALLL